jgi:hypothetical protein
MKPQEYEDLSNIILHGFPTPIAILYKQLLDEERWEIKIDKTLQIFETWMRSITLQMLIQYLDRDIATLQNDDAEQLKGEVSRIYKPKLGDVKGLFFRLLKAYQGHPELLFMKELHAIKWNPETGKKVSGVEDDFQSLVDIRNDLIHGRNKPFSEEAWRKRYEEFEELLISVLERFQFIENYRIVYAIETKLGQGLFLVLQGLEPKMISLEYSETEVVEAGRFYLDCCGDVGDFYELHPIFLPWPSEYLDWEDKDVLQNMPRKYTAIYDSYMKNKIHFAVHTADVNGLVLKDPETIKAFMDLFVERMKDIRVGRKVLDRLHWREFKDVASKITRVETEGIREKFSTDLYLQRKHIRKAFEHFLDSEKTAFVLLGQSGVGKSNFVLAMDEVYRQSEDTHMLIFNSARLSGGDKLKETLTERFASQVALVDKKRQEREIGDILKEIDSIEDIDEMKIVLTFDAINENPQPHDLLKEIDELVSYNQYPWLKVLITSRPEAWQSMKGQYRLTESKYYRQPDTEELEMELLGFNQQASGDWLAMGRFEAVELPQVYALYQEKYHLQTSFKALSTDMKAMLRDPLALRLVSETYGSEDGSKSGVLPESVRTSELYEKYIKSLIDTGRLERQDVDVFLKQKLLPLMFEPDNYRNTLDSEILTKTIDPTTDKSLSEEIELSDILSSTGKRVNQSFQNLADAGILVKQGTYSDYEISFKYERFYDFLGGMQLSSISPEDGTKAQWYRNVILHIEEHPFLWGAIRQALFLELQKEGKQGDFQIAIQLLDFQLLDKDDSSIKDILESSLIWYASDYQEEGRKLLEIVYKSSKSEYRKLAVRVAGFSGIPEILIGGGADRDKNVRFATIQAAYFYWQREPEKGWNILERWSKNVRGRFFIPNIALVESALGLTFLILTDRGNTSNSDLDIPDYQNLEIAAKLQQIWRQILKDLLFVSDREEQNITIRTRIRSGILTLLINSILPFLTSNSKTTDVRTASVIPQVQEVFKMKPSERSGFLKLQPYWEPSDEGLEKIEELLTEVFDLKNPIAIGVVVLVIQLRAKRTGDQDISVVERIFDHYHKPENPNMAPAQLVFNSGYVLRRDPEHPSQEAWESYTRLQEKYLGVGGMYYTNNREVHECSYLELYASIAKHRPNAKFEESLLIKSVNDSVTQYRDTHDLLPMPGVGKAPSILATIFTFGKLGIVYKNPDLALKATKPIITMLKEDTPTDAEKLNKYNKILEQLGVMLARLRLYYPDQVDYLLEDTDAPEKLKQITQVTAVEEDLWGDFLAYRFGPFGIRTVFIEPVRELLWRIFELTLEKGSLSDWLNYSFRYVINFIYGGQVFPTK